MSDYNEITAAITTEEPEVAVTLEELRYLVLRGLAGKAPRVNAETGNWDVYDNEQQDWVDTGISASTNITPEQLAEAIEDYFDEHPIDVPTDAVLYTPQSLTDSQKAQARTNVGAGTYSKPSGGIPASDLDQDVQDKLDSISTSGSGLTGAQIAAISALFQLAVYAEDPSDAFDAFLAAFPIYQDGSVLTIICGVTASLSDTTLTLS